ncbi:hypothetical protein ES705_29031 [subsurface metagenome]
MIPVLLTVSEHLCYPLIEPDRLADPPGNRLIKEYRTVAKLKAPLMSLGASGKLANTLVFMPWKGLNCVREYVIPANPQTDRQVTQRGYFTTMVEAIHTAMARATDPLDSDDQIAYSALAQAKGRIITWWNQTVKLGLDALRKSDGYTIYSNGRTAVLDKDDFRPIAYLTDNGVLHVVSGKFFLGTSKTNLIRSLAAAVTEADNVHLGAADGFDGLTAGVKYYWQFRPDTDDPCEGSDSGIYYGVAE